MKTKTKLACLGVLLVVGLSWAIYSAAFSDVSGPNIYQIDIRPSPPKPNDQVRVIIYCIDPSGVSGAKLHFSRDGGEWQTRDMQFFACLCIAGGRWVASVGQVSSGDSYSFYVTAFDEMQNSADSQTYTIDI